MSAFAPWQQRAFDRVAASLDGGRAGHALLFCGPALLGKRAVVDALATRVLGADRDGKAAQLVAAGTHPDLHWLALEMNKEGTKLRTEIVIEQVRALSEKLGLTPQYGDAQVAIVDPADAMNHAACNALLKTLEEPRPGRYLWLVASDPARLPATIRSRCQRVEFRLPPRDEAAAWLATRGHAAKDAAAALDAARGHPGLADSWLRDGGMALRGEVDRDLASIARGTATAADVAKRWAADEDTALRLRHAADLAVDAAARLTDPGRTRRLAAWFDRANRTRDLLRTTVRADLALVELLLAWRDDGDPGRRRG